MAFYLHSVGNLCCLVLVMQNTLVRIIIVQTKAASDQVRLELAPGQTQARHPQCGEYVREGFLWAPICYL